MSTSNSGINQWQPTPVINMYNQPNTNIKWEQPTWAIKAVNQRWQLGVLITTWNQSTPQHTMWSATTSLDQQREEAGPKYQYWLVAVVCHVSSVTNVVPLRIMWVLHGGEPVPRWWEQHGYDRSQGPLPVARRYGAFLTFLCSLPSWQSMECHDRKENWSKAAILLWSTVKKKNTRKQRRQRRHTVCGSTIDMTAMGNAVATEMNTHYCVGFFVCVSWV